MRIISASPAATEAFAARVGQLLLPGDFVSLHGELGAGKTRFAGGIARGLGVDPAIFVTSPTYTLLNIYQGRMPLYHFDLYRLSGDDDVVALGFSEYFSANGVCLVEWSERLNDEIPQGRLEVSLSYIDESSRSIELISTMPGHTRLIELLSTDVKKINCSDNSFDHSLLS